MQRRVFLTAFTLTLAGALALGAGWTRPVEGQAITPAPSPSWMAIPTNAPDWEFGRLMPDGTYCGAGCPDDDR
jgi:hypothetical protein